MIRILAVMVVGVTVLASPALAEVLPRSQFDAMIAMHAQANGVPEALVHRVIVRESRYNPRVIGKGGAMGMMQIKTATARGLGYRGTPAGLLDPETNLTYAVRYLAGAYRLARGHHDRAVSYYARGYYYAAKKNGQTIEALARPPTSGSVFASAHAEMPNNPATQQGNLLLSVLGLSQPPTSLKRHGSDGPEARKESARDE
jgi:soluble lytic murein transglycosylase-like protein